MADLGATIRIDKSLAFGCPTIELPSLRCDLLNLQEWLSKANACIQLCDCLFNAPSNVFWSSVALRPQTLMELDRVLENLPFFGDFQEGGAFACVVELAPITAELYAKTWIVFLRLTANCDVEGVNPTVFHQLVQRNSILTFRRLRLFCGLYAQQYSTCFREIITKLKQTAPIIFDQFNNELAFFLNDISALHEAVALMNAKGLGGEMRQFGAVFGFYELVQKQTREVLGWCELFHIMPDLRPSKDLLKAIPALIEDINESFADHVLKNLAVGSNQLLIGLCRSINYLKQAFTKLYIKFYENYADEFDKINLLALLVDNHELLVRVADKLHDQMGTLFQRSKLKDIVTKVRSAVDQANAKKAREIIESLREQGLLRNLGTFNSKDVEEKVEELMTILPYSKEFVHLVLRFYGYDHETALARLIEPDSLPFQLRILIKDTSLLPSGEPTRTTIHLDDVYQESDNDSEPEDNIGGDSSKSDANDLIALLTSAPKPSSSDNKPVLTAREQRLKRTEERLKKLMERSTDTLNMAQLHVLVEAMNKEQERKTEKVVEIDGKTFTKFYKDQAYEVNQADKEVLRKKLDDHKYEEDDVDDEYQRFKIEQQFEQEIGQSGRFNRGYRGIKIQDMYDDEYNDDLDEQAYGLGEGTTADEKGAGESKYAQPIGPLGLPRGVVFNEPTKGRPSKKGQKYPQQSTDSQQQPSGSGTAQSKKPLNFYQNLPAKQNRPAKQEKPKVQKQNSDDKPREQPEKAKPEKEESSENGPKQEKKKDGYTGGKSRLNKERHKNQFKQRGADRKMQKANPF